jgi:hypothetical protein
LDDRPRHASRARLLAEVAQDAFDLRFGQVVKEFGRCRLVRLRIEPHVQWLVVRSK